MRRSQIGVLALAVSAVVAATAQAQTIATFADPSSSGGSPLFSFNAGTGVLSGSWSGGGLNLLTPGVPAPDFTNATFLMTPLSTVTDLGSVRILSGGNVRFFDSSSVEVFRIDFASALLTSSLSVGASDFAGQNVTFSGSIIPAGFTTINEAFAFSFANPVATLPTGSFSTTSSFTSSATLIPTPGAAALLGLGGLVAVRRRRH